MKTKLFPIAIALFFVSASLQAQILPGNVWVNPTFEIDPTAPGGGNWGKGGSDAGIDQWSTAASLSPTHSLASIDTGGFYGEWYGDQSLASLGLNSGDTIALHWHEIFSVGAGNEMRVTVRFLDALGNGPDNHFVLSGGIGGTNSPGWTGSLATSPFRARNETLVVRTDLVNPVVTMRIALVSGGPEIGTGQYIIDDLNVVLVPEPSTLALLSVGGLVGLSVLLRRRKIAS